MTGRELIIRAFWDEEARVWVAESDDVPGLATGADTMEELVHKLERIIPELLELNAPELLDDEIPFRLEASRLGRAHRFAA
jgi:predicted RNase H-like HicB family nuclease